MDDLIREAEREAYYSVLRAFRFQSVVGLSREKNNLLAGLRKELRISQDDNRNFLRSLNNDRILTSIRKFRQGQTGSASHQHATQSMPQPVHGALQTDSPETTPPRKTRSMADLISTLSPDKDSRVKGKVHVIPYRNQHNRGQGSDNDTEGALKIRITVGGQISSPRSVKGKRVMENTTLMNEQDDSDDDSDYSDKNSDTDDDDPDYDEKAEG